jgi:hypothetical protein
MLQDQSESTVGGTKSRSYLLTKSMGLAFRLSTPLSITLLFLLTMHLFQCQDQNPCLTFIKAHCNTILAATKTPYKYVS